MINLDKFGVTDWLAVLRIVILIKNCQLYVHCFSTKLSISNFTTNSAKFTSNRIKSANASSW